MNLGAGFVLVHLLPADDKGPVRCRALVYIEGSPHAEFGCPLDPAMLDVRADVGEVCARAADSLVALVREIAPYGDPVDVPTGE